MVERNSKHIWATTSSRSHSFSSSFGEGRARSVSTYLDCFNLLFDELFDRVVKKTNLRINRYLRNLQQCKQHAIEGDKYTWLKETDKSEIRAFIGLLYMRGLLGLNHQEEQEKCSCTFNDARITWFNTR